MTPFLAAVSGEQIVQSLIWLVVVGLIFWVLIWLVNYIALPEPFGKVVRVVLAVAGALVIINVLLSLAGHPIVRW
jgi:hypothetical protein